MILTFFEEKNFFFAKVCVKKGCITYVETRHSSDIIIFLALLKGLSLMIT